jgi:hypothetical protein
VASSFSARLPVIITLHPLRANRSAVALPMPDVAPVIKAHFPRIELIITVYLIYWRAKYITYTPVKAH